ncbi:MAG: SGNH/GDSL hydrolase family protein [Phycisphaeraceae bacterium]|nr:SGNH/GDSL hydrolase family protein [Phycisphaeraceae bacterium]
MFDKQTVLLFQGDSITDCHRDKEIQEPSEHAALGRGYVLMAASRLLADHPQADLKILNRGISGNRIVDLYARWKIDAINLRPTILSILIGVNDTWHHFSRDNGVEPERYERFYRMLLEWTVARLPTVRLVLCEPFVLPCGVVTEAWVQEIDHRRRIVAELAGQFNAILVPFQSMFDEACRRAEARYWARDGVHPTPAGHQLMADQWIKSVYAALS